MADIRFQFLVNGESICIAGAEGFGNFSASFNWIKRRPGSYDRVKQEAPLDWNTTSEEWKEESLGIVAGVTDAKYPRHATWLSRELSLGDELTIRILGPGDCDSPIEIAYGTEAEQGAEH